MNYIYYKGFTYDKHLWSLFVHTCMCMPLYFSPYVYIYCIHMEKSTYVYSSRN